MVKFKTPMQALSGNWDPYPIDMAFQPPCMVLSTIGLVKPGKLDGSSTASCSKHLHQLHVCMPSSRGKTRLMYRMALDFAQWAKYVPYIDRVWTHLANQVGWHSLCVPFSCQVCQSKLRMELCSIVRSKLVCSFLSNPGGPYMVDVRFLMTLLLFFTV